MASAIDSTKPVTGAPTTASVRANFAAAKSEVEALQADKADLASPALTGTATAVNLTVSGTLNASGTLQVGGVAVTSTAAELNILDGVTATAAEINYLDGVTSNIQTQLDGKQASGSYPTTTGTGATGTWDISITGNAATATSATSASSATQATNATNLNGGQAGIGGNWTIVQSGSSLSFRYNGAAVFSISSSGAIIAENNVTAYGTAA